MKSLKDEINDGLDNFRNPVAQMGRNIRDSIVDGIGDAMADRQEKGGKYSKPRKKGCLWTLLKWYLIYLLISVVLSQCGFDDITSAGNEISETAPTTIQQISVTESAGEQTDTLGNDPEVLQSDDVTDISGTYYFLDGYSVEIYAEPYEGKDYRFLIIFDLNTNDYITGYMNLGEVYEFDGYTANDEGQVVFDLYDGQLMMGFTSLNHGFFEVELSRATKAYYGDYSLGNYAGTFYSPSELYTVTITPETDDIFFLELQYSSGLYEAGYATFGEEEILDGGASITVVPLDGGEIQVRLYSAISADGTFDEVLGRDKKQQSANSNPSTQSVSSALPFLDKQIAYADKHDIELYRFEREERALGDWLKSFSETQVSDYPIHLTFNESLFGTGQYKRTENVAEYLYYGELKDNRPDGYGMLLAYSENDYGWVSYGDYRYNPVYIGEFVEGRYEGFGLLFQESVYGYSFLMNLCPYSEGSDEFMDYYLMWVSYVRYFGEFEAGEFSGKGNDFCLLDAEIIIGSYEAVLNTIDLDDPEYTVDVANYRAGTLDGYGSQYIGGYLYYAGEFDNDQYHGYGELYYPHSNILEYKGEYKYGKRHGTGTSYSQTGEVIYEGEWENDDYK